MADGISPMTDRIIPITFSIEHFAMNTTGLKVGCYLTSFRFRTFPMNSAVTQFGFEGIQGSIILMKMDAIPIKIRNEDVKFSVVCGI